MSKSHQTCSCCGWSKVTSYQGLRTHQGKMGCTPKGLSIPQSVYNQYSPLSSYSSYTQPAVAYTPTPVKKEIHASPKYDPQPSTKMGYEPRAETEVKFRSCHCGWSKVTSYQGLRIHQGKMGCTPKGLGIPEHLQDLFNSSAPKSEATPAKPREELRSVNDKTENKVETTPAGMWQTQSMSPDHVNKTHSALDSIVGAQQFAKPTSSRQTSTANTAATNEKENTTLFPSPRQPSQPVLTQMFGQTSAPQANRNGPNVATETRQEIQQSQSLFTGPTSQKMFDFNIKQEPFIKPASFTPQHIASNTGDESMDISFGTTLPNSRMFGQSVFSWSTGAQQLQMTKSEPPNAQKTGANNSPSMEKPGFSLLKDLLVSDRALQQPSFGANPVAAQGNKPLFGSAQQPLQTSDFTGAQQFAKPTFSTANTSATNEKENKPLFPSPQQPSQPVLTQMFGQTSAPQANSNWPNVATETKEETQPYFGTTLPNFGMFGNKQSQSVCSWSTGAQQLQMTKTEPPKAQTTGANNTPPMEKPGSSLSDGALQQQSVGAAKENQSTSPKYDPQPSTKMGYEPRAETEVKFRSCHCGWSKVTSYQGLRIHQGKMGCTPKGLGIPENLQDLFNSSAPKSEATPAKPREELSSVNDTTPEYDYQASAKMRWDTELEDLRTIQQNLFSSPVQKPALKPTSRSTPDATEAHFYRENKSCFETPQQSRPSTGVDTKTRRALVFSIKEKQLQQDKIKAELQQKIKSREQKLSEIKSCVEACEGCLDQELLEINNLFSDVIRCVKKARQRARQPLENRKDKLERDSQSIIKKIQEDIKKLEQAINEVDTAADLDVNPLSKLKIKDSSKWTVDTSFSFGTLQQTVSAMMEQIQEELEKLAALELQRAPAFAVDVKLDPTTAHQCLIISKDGKKVQDGGQIQQQQQLPLAVGRFDMFGSILGANEFRSGRAYWEVQVGGKTGWDLGVASAKANRKGKLTLSPDKGYWAITHYQGENYAALAAPPVCLKLKEKPQKVGVFLDFEEGLVSFYDVTNQSHIYSFTKCSFNDSIFPYFSPHLKENGKNSEPLVITAVQN